MMPIRISVPCCVLLLAVLVPEPCYSYLPTNIVILNDSYTGDNFTSTDTFAVTYCDVDFLVNVEAIDNSTGHVLLDDTGLMDRAGQTITATSMAVNGSTVVNAPLLQIMVTIEMTADEEAHIFMYIDNVHNVTAYDVNIDVDLSSGLLIDYGSLDYISLLLGNPSSSDIISVSGQKFFTWRVGNLTGGDTKNASFTAQVQRSSLHDGVNLYDFHLIYDYIGAYTQSNGPITASVCIDRETIVTTSVLYQHGLTALTFFMALILGVILVALGFFIFFLIRKKKSVSPSNQERMMVERSKTIMMNDREALKKGGHTINDYSLVAEGDSIVGILSLKDKMQMHREIDSLDIVNTVNVDTSIEKNRNDASMNTTELLIQGLLSNNDISKGTMDTALSNLRNKRAHMDRQHDEDYKREMKKLYKKISAKNRAMMSNILNRQREEKKALVSSTQNLPPKERNDVLKLMNEQHLSEQNAETFKLKLEQDEETENLRKEFAVRNRMGMKELQQQTLKEITEQGKLTKQQADWLMSEHLKNQKALEGMYDEEISRQRQVLEEKLARRKALAMAAETQEEDQNDILNTLAGHQISTIERLKKQQVLSAGEAQQQIEAAKAEMLAVKEKMERERERQEADLHKRLSALKHKRLTDLEKQHDLETKEYDKKCQSMQTQGPIDPVAYASWQLKLVSQQRQEKSTLEYEIDIEHTDELTKLNPVAFALGRLKLVSQQRQERSTMENEIDIEHTDELTKLNPVAYASGRLKLVSQQRQERSKLENEVDMEHTDELTKLRNEVAAQTEFELKTLENNFKAKLPPSDRTDDTIQKLMRQHERELAALKEQQERSRRDQQDRLQERLARNKEEWSQRKEAEKVEQEQLREYEEQVISKLVSSQVSMSDEERDRILKEHEKQMVKLENSLTLNKLRQKRMIEEKLAHKRAQQMEKLQLKQHKEKENQRRIMENNAEDSDDDSQLKKVKLMKEHVEQKMAVLQGRKLDWNDELESIRIEMLKERSLALKEQEERLGTLVAGLQLSKAKEMAKIEEQQMAIHNLKTSLIDDLNARGVLSDPETNAVIRRHQEEQEQLNRRLDEQRERQEAILKQKLQDRLEQREKSMIKAQDEELKNLIAPSKTAAKIKRMMLIHKHMVAMEKMRNQLEREISQNLEQVRYEYEVCKRKAVQDQEMEFIAGLVRVGTIPKQELEAVLHQLYPNKTDAEFKEIFDKIFDPNLQPKTAQGESFEHSQLLDRVKFTQKLPSLSRGSSSLSLLSSRDSLRRNSKKKKPQYPPPIPAQTYDGYDDDDDYRRQSYNENPRLMQNDYHPQPQPRFRREIRDDYNQFSKEDYRRQSFEDAPHPLEDTYNRRGSQKFGKQNGFGYANPIMEDEDDVVSAQYVQNNYSYAQQPSGGKLPPLQAEPKKKKKKKFLKKMAHHHDEDEDL